MNPKPNLIFDAGGVLVFPNFDRLAEIGNRVGIITSPEEIAMQHAKLFHGFDEYVAQHHKFPQIQYFQNLIERLTDSRKKILAAVEIILEVEKEQHLWATTELWISKTLQNLKSQGYPMAVISNSEGTVEQILVDLDLRQYFEGVIDSFIVGVEKPDPRIFEIALEQLNWTRTDTIYIGDIFYVDVLGANRAGLGAIHLDKMGLYNDWDGIHLQSIKELLRFLAQSNGNIQELDLYPARDFSVFDAP